MSPISESLFVRIVEYVDGSIMFNFGTSEEAATAKTPEQMIELAIGATTSGKESEGTSDQPDQLNGLSKNVEISKSSS